MAGHDWFVAVPTARLMLAGPAGTGPRSRPASGSRGMRRASGSPWWLWLRFGQVACRILAADQLGGAGIAAGSTITSASRVHHTRPLTQGPHDDPHDRRLAWVARDGAVAGSR